MGLIKYITKKVDNLGATISSASGTIALGQIPQYISQYTQRLSGQLEGTNPSENTERISALREGLETITNSGAFGKLGAFIQNVDSEIAQKVYENYTPGITFDTEGLLYCGVGALAGLATYELGKVVFKKGLKLEIQDLKSNFKK